MSLPHLDPARLKGFPGTKKAHEPHQRIWSNPVGGEKRVLSLARSLGTN